MPSAPTRCAKITSSTPSACHSRSAGSPRSKQRAGSSRRIRSRCRTTYSFLTWDEAIAALRVPSEAFAELVAERRATFAAAEAFEPPASYGSEPAPPPMSILPPVAREAMEVMMYIQDNVFEAEMSGARAESGTTGDPGPRRRERLVHRYRPRHHGRARVRQAAARRRTGLPDHVARVVDPVREGERPRHGYRRHPLSPGDHRARIRHPAVVATGNATQLIRDGQQVLVDGDAGIVRILT